MSEEHDLFYLVSILVLVVLATASFFLMFLILKIYKKIKIGNQSQPTTKNYDYWNGLRKEAITADVGFNETTSSDNLDVISLREVVTF